MPEIIVGAFAEKARKFSGNGKRTCKKVCASQELSRKQGGEGKKPYCSRAVRRAKKGIHPLAPSWKQTRGEEGREKRN